MSAVRQHRPGPSEMILAIALAVSVAVHALILAFHFVSPESFKLKAPDSNLEVVLVNAKSKTRPSHPNVLAQVDSNGGGEHDKGQATSFLARSDDARDGQTLKASEAAQARLEEQQRILMSQLRSSTPSVASTAAAAADNASGQTGASAAEMEHEIRRREAIIDREIRDYEQRPRRGYIGPNSIGVAYALYRAQYIRRVEDVGNRNYPPEVRGKLYGDVILSVTLKPDGSIYHDEITVVRSSGNQVLDRAARRIALMGAPYGPFTAEMRKQYDIYEIVMKYRFTKSDGLEAKNNF